MPFIGTEFLCGESVERTIGFKFEFPAACRRDDESKLDNFLFIGEV
jgi:hypothetical protein